MLEPALGRRPGTALLDHQDCWGSCYCCCYCLTPSWQTGHEGGLLLERVRRVLVIASSRLKWTKFISLTSFRAESSVIIDLKS